MKCLRKSILIHPLFFTLCLIFKQSLSSDPYYEACVPKRCSENGTNISYPFFIQGLHNSSCGYPGLDIKCRNGSAILRISDNDFRVEQIDYDERYLRLQTVAVLPNGTVSCPSGIRNLTLDRSRFVLDNVTTTPVKLVFISNCFNNSRNEVLDRYRVRSCDRMGELVMLANDTRLRTAKEICGIGSGIVTTPVELSGGEGRSVVVDGTNYAEVVGRGFVLRWLAADCGDCRKSGGRCGVHLPSNQFRCFCTDRPHRVSCKPGKNFRITWSDCNHQNSAQVYLKECRIREIRNFSDVGLLVSDETLDQNLKHERSCEGVNTTLVLVLPELLDQLNITFLKCPKSNFFVKDCHELVDPTNDVIPRFLHNQTVPKFNDSLYSEFWVLIHSRNCKMCDRGHDCKAKGKTNNIPLIIAVVCGSVFAVVVIAAFMLRRGYKRNAFAYFSSKDKSQDLEDASVFGVPVFSYAELQDATHNFDTSQELGDGGFGTVYYGKLRDGREVAVKRLYEHNYKRVQQFMNEVEILTRLRHKHLVSLYGCTSRRSRELLLVYEYISNGTVADHLHGELVVKATPLTWPIRMKVAVETASALVYLHASEIIHRDVKTNNILLDQNFCVKVADFGLSRLLPNDVTHVSTAPQGTPGYVDPEYHQCYQLTDKSDVYSFGVVLIELISSMPAIDISRSREEISLANMAINRIQKCALDELIDPFLRSDPDNESMTKLVAELAFRCLQFDSDSRPTMVEVLEVLKGIQGGEVENTGELNGCIIKPPASPEIEDVGLLKGLNTASPISVTAKWHSNSSGVTTPTSSSV
ncbi:hypothetical protein OSB04_018328 [Centaurea solstitialis]|uniref:non-specific serine/threonine protein kinase n=1 Tax=Centaurea solstitialis TaxID=347529 RepID=A0AA38TC67_9ASTR|nr:hypothetical protein OSB04_018328 [Centaurea solstitialis]